MPTSGTLVFSFIGKTSQDVAVGNRGTVDVTLADDTKPLQEVVVVGYGSQRRRDVTGDIASISSNDFQKGNIINPEQLLAGKLAGVSITPPSGQSGGGNSGWVFPGYQQRSAVRDRRRSPRQQRRFGRGQHAQLHQPAGY